LPGWKNQLFYIYIHILEEKEREETLDWEQNRRCELLMVKTIYVKINMTAAHREKRVSRECFEGDAANMAKLHEKCACWLLSACRGL
jgi:hypothetical protein